MKRKSTIVKNATKPQTPTPLLVELATENSKDDVLASAHQLAGESSLKDGYLRPNRTSALQAVVNRLVKDKNEANEDIKKNETSLILAHSAQLAQSAQFYFFINHLN